MNTFELYFVNDIQFPHNLAKHINARNYSVYDLNYSNFFDALEFCVVEGHNTDLIAVSIDPNKLSEQSKLDCVEYLQRSIDSLIIKLKSMESTVNKTIGIKEYNIPKITDPLTLDMLKGYDNQIKFLLSEHPDNFDKFWVVGTFTQDR